MAEKIDSPSKLLLNIKKQEFATSEKLYRIKLSKQNSPASDPSLKCRAKYDPDTDQAIVFLNCKGTHSAQPHPKFRIQAQKLTYLDLECSCDNKYIWLQKEKNSLYYWKPQ